MDSGKRDRQAHELPGATSVLAVCAHPDDESFGLGATLAGFTAAGSSTAVLCFTHGESSTLGAITTELGQVRVAELADAASELGVDHVELFDYRDGALDREPIDRRNTSVKWPTGSDRISCWSSTKGASPGISTMAERPRPHWSLPAKLGCPCWHGRSPSPWPSP